MKRRFLKKLFLLLLVLFAQGCATLCPPRPSLFSERPEQCEAFLERLEEAVRKAGVKDSSSYCIPRFPYLRSNRFLAALRERLEDERAREHWLRWMKDLALEAREKEIQNLPDEAILALNAEQGGTPDRSALYRRVASCSNDLFSHDQRQPGLHQTLNTFVGVPDEYSLLMRTAGVYPLASIPVTIVTGKVRKEIRSWFDEDLEDLPTEGKVMTFAPGGQGLLPQKEIEHIMEESRQNALQTPILDRSKTIKLASHFAPVFSQDVGASYDRFGRVTWSGDSLEVRFEEPTVYWYVSHAFFKGMPILQINYVTWYPRRDGKKSPWVERGHLDGLTIRVSLDGGGQPFMVDVMNNCGCYHFFSPQRDRVERIVSKRLRLDPFVPQWLPAFLPAGRLGIRVNSGWHQVERLISAKDPAGAARYELVPYEALESLPQEDGMRESMFDARGIAKGSGRIEPVIFFPMGIPSVGSMRQRGHHAIALAGRTHFDDPFLFDQNFVFK